MGIWKIVIIASLLCAVVISSFGCASESGSAVSENQIVTVQRGDLTIDITAVGNLALSDKVDLAFEMDGTVEEVLVEEAESVEEGQLLAKLDTSAWEDYIAGLEDKVTTAERNVTAKERAVTTAERQVLTKQMDVLQAQSNLQTAEDNLNKVDVIAQANDAVEDAEYDLRIAQAMYKQALLSEMATEEANFWTYQISLANKELAEAQKELKDILAGSSVKVTTDVATALAINKLQVEVAQGRLEDAQTAVEDAQTAVEDAKKAVEDAKKAVEDAKKAVEDAKNTSPEVTAPFDGFITKVSVKGGDEVKKGTVAVTLADPNKFEADILVNEMDFLQVKLGGEAWVQVDAVPGVSLSANVTHISPTAVIQSGVVNYKVTVELQSLQPVSQEQQQARGNLSSDNISSGAPSRGFRQLSVGDNLTQEQIDQMIQQRQQAQAGQPGGQQPQMTTTVSQDLQLREGLTITVSLIVEQKSSVLLVPIQAIISRGTETLVQVLKDGVIEEPSITVGISNEQYTEVTSGLSEGEQVVIPQTTTTTSTTTQQGGQGGIRIPGMGGFGQ